MAAQAADEAAKIVAAEPEAPPVPTPARSDHLAPALDDDSDAEQDERLAEVS